MGYSGVKHHKSVMWESLSMNDRDFPLEALTWSLNRAKLSRISLLPFLWYSVLSNIWIEHTHTLVLISFRSHFLMCLPRVQSVIFNNPVWVRVYSTVQVFMSLLSWIEVTYVCEHCQWNWCVSSLTFDGLTMQWDICHSWRRLDHIYIFINKPNSLSVAGL